MRRRLVVIAVVLVVVLAIADVLARRYSESNIERAVRRNSLDVSSVSAHIESFPFVGRLLLWSKVPHLDLELRDLRVEIAGAVEELRVDVDGLELDRGVLVNDRRVRITDVDRVRVTAVIDLEHLLEVARAAGIDVTIDDGKATFDIAGVQADAEVTVEDGFVVLTAGALPPIRLPLPESVVLPCQPSGRIDGDELVVSCESDTLPQVVIDAIGRIDVSG